MLARFALSSSKRLKFSIVLEPNMLNSYYKECPNSERLNYAKIRTFWLLGIQRVRILDNSLDHFIYKLFWLLHWNRFMLVQFGFVRLDLESCAVRYSDSVWIRTELSGNGTEHTCPNTELVWYSDIHWWMSEIQTMLNPNQREFRLRSIFWFI